MLEAVARLTSVKSPKFIPEIKLHCVLPDEFDYPFRPDDFNCMWGYPTWSGIAVSRFILDNPKIVRGKRVADLGCGSGVVSVAASQAGAEVISIDRDVAALYATQANLELNQVTAQVIWGSFDNAYADVVIMSSLFYDPSNHHIIEQFIRNRKVIIGGKLPDGLYSVANLLSEHPVQLDVERYVLTN